MFATLIAGMALVQSWFPLLQMYERGHGWGWGAWLFMSIVMLIFWASVIALGIWVVRSLGRGHTHAPSGPAPLDIARERYARGEISDEEFERIKRGLSSK